MEDAGKAGLLLDEAKALEHEEVRGSHSDQSVLEC